MSGHVCNRLGCTPIIAVTLVSQALVYGPLKCLERLLALCAGVLKSIRTIFTIMPENSVCKKHKIVEIVGALKMPK